MIKSKKQIKKLGLLLGLLLVVLVATGCKMTPVTNQSTGFWDHTIVYNFSRFILWLAGVFGNSYGWAIVAFTIIIRIIILPLNWWQSKTMVKQQELMPEIQALQKKYPGKDVASRQKLQEEQQKIYTAAGVNPVAGCLPMLVQLPIMMALYHAIYRTEVLKSGTFLWMELGKPDPLYIMGILAAIFTFLTSYLTMMSQPTKNAMSTAMLIFMPIMILFWAIKFPSAISIYWVVTNAFSVLQTLVIQNPFKIKRERQAKIEAQKEKEKNLKKAKKKAQRRK